jgi:hypothetical protein
MREIWHDLIQKYTHDPGPKSSEILPPPTKDEREFAWHAFGIVAPGWLAAHLGLKAGEIIAIADSVNVAGIFCVNAIGKWRHPPAPESLV